jgi:hypothetical protein
MNSRARAASVVALLLLFGVGVARAQSVDSTSSKPTKSTQLVPTSGALPGRGAIGGQIGSSWIVAGGDYAKGSQPRLTFMGHFRYQSSTHWGWQVSPYFTWNGYVSHADAPYEDLNFPGEGTSKEFYLTQLIGADSQVQWFNTGGRTRWHVGVGPSVYRVVIENHRKVLKDPISLELHSGTHIGGSAEFGYEKFMGKLPNTSIELTAAWHIAFAKSEVRWQAGWNDNPQAIEFRIGAHYYYDFRKPKPKSTKPGLTP